MRPRVALLVLVSSFACGEGSAPTAGSEPPLAPPKEPGGEVGARRVWVATDPGLGAPLRRRVLDHLRARYGAGVTEVDPTRVPAVGPSDVTIGLGDTALTRELVSAADVASLPSEGFVLRADATGRRIAVDGRDGRARDRRGVAFGAYALLERLGQRFLHPLAPSPAAGDPPVLPSLDVRESPRWRLRGLQLHTMHPTELADMLNGWGPGGPDDEAGFRATLDEWERFLEWMVANRQNHVHWVLLEADSWATFAQSPTRQARLAELVSRAHGFGVEVGIDVPIALQQQHTFRLLTKQGELGDELAQIRARVDWLMAAGFDYLATENGTTEFTHPPPARMLAWMSELARHLDERHGKPSFIKIHASTGQSAAGYPDPRTGAPINFNFLPHFADPRLGIMPHTVQHYGLDDRAPTYGNKDFAYMRDFLRYEVGRRPVVWHPETAYWVSFDVDVPLFLPVYAERRVHDLRLLAADERSGLMNGGGRMDGQMTFSSGWEWGYWLNDVVTARASWDPHEEAPSDDAALRAILEPLFAPAGATSGRLVDAVAAAAKSQKALLIDGTVGGVTPANPERRNGQAYLQGFEAWDDVSALGAAIPGLGAAQMTQPARLGLVEMRTPIHPPPRYTGEVEPLLAAMDADFGARADAMEAIARDTTGPLAALAKELADAARVTALRARQVHGLYDYVDGVGPASPGRFARLAVARKALDDAAVVVKRREAEYRVPLVRVAGWRRNPTSYPFGYLWTVHTLHYLWRDEGKAVDAPRSPCYLNVLNLADIGMGEGIATDGGRALRSALDAAGMGDRYAECASEPASEPVYPPDGLRTRP